VDFEVVTDTGPGDAVRELADELRQVSADFARATATVPGELLIGLRCLPEALGRRSFSRFDRASQTLTIDVTVSEERFAGQTVAWQREELGRVLWERLAHGVATTSAPWVPAQRDAVHLAAQAMLRSVGWLDGARARARDLLDRGHAIDQVAETVGLDTDEIEDIYMASLAERG
jgi:monoamine oxidase